MNRISLALLVVAALGLGACTNASRFGQSEPAGFGDQQSSNTDFSATAPGFADPSSPAYFQEAIGDRVLFDVDQHTLNAQARAILDAQARWLADNPEYQAVIEGHADEQGTREYNLALGGRRANSVYEYLISRGVAASRLKFLTFGKERPIEVCSDEACYAKNRRAVTVIAGGAIS